MEVDIAKILLTLVVVLVAAKLAAELAERIRVPVVVAEIIAGIIVGPSVLGWVPSPAMAQGDFTAELLAVLGEIGVILLLLEVGLEMRLSELRAVGRASMTVAFIGVGVPMLAGWGAAASSVSQGTPPCSWVRRWQPRRWASRPACSPISARSAQSRPARCWALRSSTTYWAW